MRLSLNDTERFMFVDLAGARTAKQSKRLQGSRQAISVAGRWMLYEGLPYWISWYSWAGNVTPTQLRDKIITIYEDYQPRLCGIEANGLQSLYGATVKEEAKKALSEIVRIIPVTQPTKIDKDFRIVTALKPLEEDGRLIIPDDQVELRAEYDGHPTAATKDRIDALASAINLAPVTQPKRVEASRMKDYARYLRDRGVKDAEIEKRLKELTAHDVAERIITDIGIPRARQGVW